MRIVDLRSDTVTKPTPAMRKAMFEAEVGDDVYEEDPTVIGLEKLAAKTLGFEAGLFMISGTMGNLVAVLTHSQRGDEVILHEDSHIYYYEVGGMSALAGVMPRLIQGNNGKIQPQELLKAIRPSNIHYPKATLLCLENTVNRGGGIYYSSQELRDLYNIGKENNLKVHIDGARIFHAAIAADEDIKEMTQYADSIMFCLSKGLCAPIGSILVGSKEFIERARKWRKMLGGGTRQVGVVAAAGLVALQDMVHRLADDHALAQYLAKRLNEIEFLTVEEANVQTNIVLAQVDITKLSLNKVLQSFKEKGILINAFGPTSIRFVTHNDLGEEDIDYTIEQLKSIQLGE